MDQDQQTIHSYNAGAGKYNEVQPDSFFHKYVEKPAMFSLLPDIKGKRVLCIGVGTGHEAGELKAKGAEVIGIDASTGMIAQAKANFPDIEFQLQDLNAIDFPAESFDLVYSSLALHYAKDLSALFKSIQTILKPGGHLLFSTTHPVFDAVEQFKIDDKRFQVIGHCKNMQTKEVEPLGNYFQEEVKTQDWGDGFIVNFYHYTLTTWVNSMLQAKLELVQMLEPKPIAEAKDLFPAKYAIYSHRPGFIIFLGSKR